MKTEIMTRDQLVSWLHETGYRHSEAVRTSMVTLTVLLNRPGSSNRIKRSVLAEEWHCQSRWVGEKLTKLRKKDLIDFEIDDTFSVYYFHRVGPKP
jgi:hypothetical protein